MERRLTQRSALRNCAVTVLCCLALAAAPESARADAGDLAFGVSGGYATPREGRLLARGSYGISDALALRVDVGAGFADEFTRGLASGGIVYAYDVVSWVPELGVYGGVSFADGTSFGRAAVLAGMRRYINRATSVTLSAGAEYDGAQTGGDHVHALIDLTLWLH